MHILDSKLQIPRRMGILHRHRLLRLFDDIREKKMVAVTAGAGFGKTTLVMDALAKQPVLALWYRLDEADTDFQVFLAYLYAAVLRQAQSSSHIPEGESGWKPVVKDRSELLLAWLGFIQGQITEPAVLVLDDYHLVDQSVEINTAIDFIGERLPEHIRMIVISRHDLPLKLSTLRARQQLVEISETDLLFTKSEIEDFYKEDFLPAKDHIEQIYSGTSGWAAGLVLLRYAVKSKPDRPLNETISQLKKPGPYLFSYLAENLFDPQQDHVKEFMMKASLVDEIDTKLCERLFDISDARGILDEMVQNHLLIYPVDDTGRFFYLHHLFRDFLRSRLAETASESDIRQLHCRIARELESSDFFSALDHYIEGGAFEDAVRLFKDGEMKFLLDGKILFMGRCLDKIPVNVFEENPRLLLARAKQLSYYGDPKQAMEQLTRAHLLFKKQGAKNEMVDCLIELGSQYYFTGHVREAKLLMEQVLDDVQKPSMTYIVAMTYLTFLSSVLGEFDTAGGYYEEVFEQIDTLPEFERTASTALINTSRSYTLFLKGDFELGLKITHKLIQSALDLKLDPCLPLAYYQLSAIHHLLQNYDNGIKYAKKGIESCEKTALNDSRKGWNYLVWAQNCIGLKNYDKAKELLDAAMELFEAPGNRWATANALNCLYEIYLAEGEHLRAEKILLKADRLIKGYGLRITHGILGNSLADVYLNQNKYNRALTHLDSSRPSLEDTAYYLFSNHLMSSRARFETGEFNASGQHLFEALRISGRMGYNRLVSWDESWIARLLEQWKPQKNDIRQKTAALLAGLTGSPVQPLPPVLKINCFGRFSIRIESRRLERSGWKSTKALGLLKFLALNRHKGFLPREVLIEVLWPEADFTKTAGRFNMAMSALRKTLEPELPPKSPSSYIERKKDTYRLYTDKRIEIDLERFERAAQYAGKKERSDEDRLKLDLEAHSLCTGPLLEEDRYEPWCMERRDRADSLFAGVLDRLVRSCEQTGDLKQAVQYARQRRDLDPYDDKIYGRLMQLYHNTGRPGKVEKIYSDYLKMAQEMDFPVSSEMERLYTSLIEKR